MLCDVKIKGLIYLNRELKYFIIFVTSFFWDKGFILLFNDFFGCIKLIGVAIWFGGERMPQKEP